MQVKKSHRKKNRVRSEVCQEEVLHHQAIRRVTERFPSESVFLRMSEFYKAFSSPSRVKILSALSASELCVYDIASILKLSPSAVSHQLNLLKTLRLVKSRRDRKQIYYSLDDEHILAILAIAREHLAEK